MTGAEVYIMGEKHGLLGKVRHDGDDVVEFFSPDNLRKFSEVKATPQDIWKAYRAERKLRGWEDYPESEIDTKYPDGFVFPIEDFYRHISDSCPEDCSEFFPVITEGLLAERDEEDGLLCSYSDYVAFIYQKDGNYVLHETSSFYDE